MSRISRKIKHLLGYQKNESKSPPQKNNIPEFINWLRFANAGMLNEGNIYAIEYAIKNLPSKKSIIEIGSFCGLSTNVINHYLMREGLQNRLVTCDKWEFEGADLQNELINGGNVTHRDYKKYVKDSYIRNVEFFSSENLPYTIEEFSDDFFNLWDKELEVSDIFGRKAKLGGEISFAYIDGNHSYEFAKRDYINVDKFLEIGGFILFDDSGDNSGWEVCRVIEEIKRESKYELIMNNPNYLFRKLK
jgi:hypothetical protein